MWLCAALAGAADDRFDFDVLKNRAQNLAVVPYQPTDESLPEALQNLNYDDMRNIRFDPKLAFWRWERLPFQLQFIHRGGPQSDHITVNYVENGQERPIPFSKNLFNYSQAKINGNLPDDLGFNGFRIHYPINTAEYLDEVVVFQGASYFRSSGKNMRYGLSARGLAIRVIGDTPEEFPEFTDFWVEKPDNRADRIKIYALLNSPSLTGAYEMMLIPGDDTVMEIKATLFARKTTSGLGLAPLTSMFWFGEFSTSRFGDFRPEVHDSDGLLIHTGSNEWLWRPLSNEGGIKISCFAGEKPLGFGLFQRDRNYSSYEDTETFYQNRPSTWVEPVTGFDHGEIRLVELPTHTEYADNIVAFWTPAEPLTPDQPLEFSYRLHWFADNAALPPLASTRTTRIGNSTEYPGSKKIVLDFNNTAGLDRNSPDSIKPVISLSNGTLKNSILLLNGPDNTWRVCFDVEPVDRTQPVEMRCFLQSDGLPRSETWTYYLKP